MELSLKTNLKVPVWPWVQATRPGPPTTPVHPDPDPTDNPSLERFNRTIQEEWLELSETGLDDIQKPMPI